MSVAYFGNLVAERIILVDSYHGYKYLVIKIILLWIFAILSTVLGLFLLTS